MASHHDRYLDDAYRDSIATLVEPHPHLTDEEVIERFLEHCVGIDDAVEEELEVPTIRRMAYQRLSEEIDEE